MKLELKPYQEKTVEFALERGAAALFLDPGLGKTLISLTVFDVLQSEGLVDSMLVIAPLSVCHLTWAREHLKFDDLSHLRVEVLHGPKKNDLINDPDVDVWVINPEGLAWYQDHCVDQPNMLVVDESTVFKNTQGKRYKILKDMLNGFTRRYILSGSALSNRYEDLFGQFYLLDGGATLGSFITHFRRRFCNKVDMWNWELRDGAEDEILEAIAPITHHLTIEDYEDMPDYIENVIPVKLPPKARQHYEAMEKTYLTEMAEGLIVASNAGSAANKMRQIASGQMLDEAGKVHPVHEAKFVALSNLVAELNGSPLLVGVDYQHDAKMLSQMFDAPAFVGGATTRQKQQMEAAWNRGELPVMIGHPASMGHGLNLQAGGHTIAWYTLPWSYELYDQFNRRLYRQGQEHPVVVHHIVAENTIDAHVGEVLIVKEDRQMGFFEKLKAYKPKRKSR